MNLRASGVPVEDDTTEFIDLPLGAGQLSATVPGAKSAEGASEDEVPFLVVAAEEKRKPEAAGKPSQQKPSLIGPSVTSSKSTSTVQALLTSQSDGRKQWHGQVLMRKCRTIC